MRITKKQSEENKARVVASAGRLFREKGFAGVGVADLMRNAGMTHGGFYNHFESKDELEAEACGQVLSAVIQKLQTISAMADECERRHATAAFMRRYVSKKARDAAAPSCPMFAFSGEMPRQSAQVREAYSAGLRKYLDAFTLASGGEPRAGKPARQEALVRFASLTGALILARSVASADLQLSDEILEAASAALDWLEADGAAEVARRYIKPTRSRR
jgi:TetR/AcrR family transcriptional repressor of nem operon